MSKDLSPHTNINDVPYAVLLKLHTLLDIGDRRNNWRAFIAAIPDNPYREISDVETFGLEQLSGRSPTASLLRDLGNRGRTVGQIISYLESMKHEKALKLLKREEPVRIIKQPVSISLMANDTLTLTCEASGFPYPSYQWFRTVIEEVNGKPQHKSLKINNGTDKVLEIPDVSDYDTALYICRVHNRISFQNSSWVKVDVISKHEPPKIEVQPRSQTVEVGKPIRLICEATGTPTPLYQWYRMEQHIADENNSVLHWDKARLTDEALYVCKVYNKHGEVWTEIVEVNVIPKGPPVIMRQPTSVDCVVGDKVVFTCEVRGKEPLYYQWFKDGKKLAGENKKELCFKESQHRDRGEYECQIRNANGGVTSQPVRLMFMNCGLPPPEPQHATDKVALVIANEEYRSEVRLHAPGRDAKTIHRILTEQCGFKVVSLIDLTKEEMWTAVHAFCDLLGKGVYGLFYFAGHGFDANGQSYLVPVDARSAYGIEHCLCAQSILEEMQKQNTGLNVMLLDICRTQNEYIRDAPVKTYKPEVKGNTVFGYASSFTTGAFEVSNAENGIFMKYLKKHLANDEKVTVMLDRVIAEVSHDPDAKERQFPEVKSDLREYRTLRDPIKCTGHTKEFHIRRQKWALVNQVPIDSPVCVKISLDLGSETIHVIVKMSFYAEFSNVLWIDVHVEDPGTTSQCKVKIQDFPPELDVSIKYLDRQYGNTVCDPRHTHQTINNKILRATVKNIQKLYGPLRLSIALDVTHRGKVFCAKHPFSLPEPLIAKSQIFKRRPVEQSYPLT
ncbi:mucosa-associated lymphoid tissue lymphoma translocation protein 1-like isoform X2 [Ptychodera flava]|uniref:mucosa-associated lymphoid tissue lymphoma translocation protein 1-like isoform X2 n=1 Tax=Ptychodera flava TaxID=63121 RepID=UPI003969DC9A